MCGEISTMSSASTPADSRLNDIEAKLEAFNNARRYLMERVEELEEENEELRQRVAELEADI